MSEREDNGYALGKSPCHLLHRAQQLAADRFGAADITLRQFAVLAAVSNRNGQSQTELVSATGIDRSTLADMILRMEERGLLSRGRSADDGRAKSVMLTSGGRSALASAAPRARSADDAIMAALPRAKRAPFLETLRVLAEVADSADTEPTPAKKNGRAPARKGARGAKKARKPASRTKRARR
jgi:DNA-binding MarR family transcriptional regulator